MPSLYVLDVPEFAPLLAAARARDGVEITGPTAGYFRISAGRQLRLYRADSGLPEALWFGAFTAGFEGEELVIDAEQFWIGPSVAPAKATDGDR